MHAQPYELTVEIRPAEVEAIALVDLAEADRRPLQRDRLISHRFIRAGAAAASSSDAA